MGIFCGRNSAQRLYAGGDAMAAYYGTELVWQPAGDAGADWLWKQDSSGVTLLLYRGNARALTIPSSIEGIPVTALAATACNYADVTSVTIPVSVRVLG